MKTKLMIFLISIIMLYIVGCVSSKQLSDVPPIQNNEPGLPHVPPKPKRPQTNGGFILTDTIKPYVNNNVSVNAGVGIEGTSYNKTIVPNLGLEESHISFDLKNRYKKLTFKLFSMGNGGHLKVTGDIKTLWEQDLSIQNPLKTINLDLVEVNTLEFSGRHFMIIDPIIFPKEPPIKHGNILPKN